MRFLRDVQSVLTAVCGLTLALSFVPGWKFLVYISVGAGAYFALAAAWRSLKDRSIDVNFLMVLAAVGAVVVGHPEDAAGLLFLFSLSSTLESHAMARTRSAIENLIKLRPDSALLITAEGDRTLPVEELQVDDRIRVLPFSAIPTDGDVLEGATSVDQSAMTGESLPVAKTAGDQVIGGTQNLEGMIVVTVKSTVGNSALDRIVALVRDAQENKASGERISAWFGQRYTYFVLAAFGISLLVRQFMTGSWSEAMALSLTLLVALSPCALVISTPATTLSALAWAARNGILIRGGEFIERAGGINTVALDKTGTLTSGRFQLSEICVCSEELVSVGAPGCLQESACWHGSGELSGEALAMLQLAAAAEQYSTHPVAQAIVAAARENGIDVTEANSHEAIPGFGVVAEVGGLSVRIGQARFFGEQHLNSHFLDHVKTIQSKGMTTVIMQAQGQLCAFGLQDSARNEARSLIGDLRDLGVDRVLMLTGDTHETASAVAAKVGIQEIHPALLPADKTVLIQDLVRSGRKVAMVGDGINDAPALASADLGIAMGGLGSDAALNASDVVLMRDDLHGLPALIRLGRKTNGAIRANLVFASAVIIGLTVASLFFHLPLPLAVIGHEGSTVVVILNGLRLLKGP